jgi:hypothetical protein
MNSSGRNTTYGFPEAIDKILREKLFGHIKSAVVGAGAPPDGGGPQGAPPPQMDPAAMQGGMPPGGGQPPMDPAAAMAASGGAPMPGAPGDMQGMIQQAVMTAMQNGGGKPGAGANGKPKVDVNNELPILKKLLTGLYVQQGLQLPEGLTLDVVNDPMTGMAMGGAPGMGGPGMGTSGMPPGGDPAAMGGGMPQQGMAAPPQMGGKMAAAPPVPPDRWKFR